MSESRYDQPITPAGYLQFVGCRGPIGSLPSLNDVRLWSVTRTEEDVAATMCDKVESTEVGLILNWDSSAEDALGQPVGNPRSR